MYKKVSTNLNFVDREKETEKFWDDNHIFEKIEKKDQHILFMMDLQQLTENHISDTY